MVAGAEVKIKKSGVVILRESGAKMVEDSKLHLVVMGLFPKMLNEKVRVEDPTLYADMKVRMADLLDVMEKSALELKQGIEGLK